MKFKDYIKMQISCVAVVAKTNCEITKRSRSDSRITKGALYYVFVCACVRACVHACVY